MSASSQVDWFTANAPKPQPAAPQEDWFAANAPKAAPPEPSTYEKLTRSYNPDVEEYAAKHPILGPAARFFDAAGGAVMAFPENAYEGLRHPIESAKSIGGAINAYNPWNPNHISARGALSVLPEALGQGAGNVAAGEAASAIPKAMPLALRSPIAKATRTMEGTGPLKRGVRGAATLAAGAYLAPRILENPIWGTGEMMLGAKYAPEVLDRVLPKLQPTEEQLVERGVQRGLRNAKIREAVKAQSPGNEFRVGSPGQETGYYPAVTKVPIRPEPPYKLTPESVPGPDTAGKGNLLSPLAKKGDPRAAKELMRRGRNVLYVPAEEYPGPRETVKFKK